MHEPTYYIGLMSGTSMDAIDAALVDFASHPPQLLATYRLPISSTLKRTLFTLCRNQGTIVDLAQMDVILGELFAQAVKELLKISGLKNSAVRAVGSHGQTIRHHPHDEIAFTLQIADPHIIAARTGITTVADFRRRDVALGGQGAPLTPAFHHYLLQNQSENCWVLNIGGIANLTRLPKKNATDILGFDTGPGNTLMDHWCRQHLAKEYDERGQWAAQGTIVLPLLEKLLADDFFKTKPPKSTGTEYFNLAWLAAKDSLENYPAADVQATLLALTAQSITQHLQLFPDCVGVVWICGGGAHNNYLLQKLCELNPQHRFSSTTEIGIPPDWIEAVAFAWLAKRTIEGESGNLPSVTGASQAAILGAIYPVAK